MTKAFKLFFFLSTIIIVVQCNPKQTMEAEVNLKNTQKLNILSFEALPAEIKSKIITAETKLKATVTHHKALKPFGSPKFNTIHQRLGENGSQSYTLGLKKTSEGLYYDNLVINQDAEGNTRTHIIRYQPERTWYRKHKTEGLGYPHYSGDIHIFSQSGTLLSSVTLISGRPVQKTTQDDTHVGHRANDQEMSCNVIDIEYVGGCAGEECWWSEIIITLNCTGAGGSSDGMHNDEGYGQGGANGPQHEDGQHGGGGGRGPVHTVPVEEDEPVEEDMDDGIDNDITDPCARNIFEDLITGQLQDHPISPEVQIPDEGINFTFSDIILDIFNHSETYDYVVENENLSNSNASPIPLPHYNDQTGRYEITTTFNTNYLNQATTLSIARTMIHESIHAYLVYKYRNDPKGDIRQALNALASEYGYDNINVIHHEFYGQYINAIAYSLYSWDKNYGSGGNLSWSYYYSMAWGGLTQYEVFQTLVPNADDRQEIEIIIENEKDNNTNAQGYECE